MSGYPWSEGDALRATELNAAIAAASGATEAGIIAFFASLPTSPAGLNPGDMFWNGDVLCRKP
jgi:hypothetical protein